MVYKTSMEFASVGPREEYLPIDGDVCVYMAISSDQRYGPNFREMRFSITERDHLLLHETIDNCVRSQTMLVQYV